MLPIEGRPLIGANKFDVATVTRPVAPAAVVILWCGFLVPRAHRQPSHPLRPRLLMIAKPLLLRGSGATLLLLRGILDASSEALIAYQ